MDNSDITSLYIEACKSYYKFLETKNIGKSLIRVHEIISTSIPGIYKLKLTEPLFNIEAISFLINDKEYDTTAIKIVEYDYDNRTLLIKPDSVDFNFPTIENKNIFVISDLKFLVKRLEQFYRDKGHSICFPNQISDSNFDSLTYDYPPKFIPSESQKRAIELILKNSLTYIWGAPGTGKTRYVLANCLLKCFKENKKVLILAPTNVALEQVMIGLLRFTDACGIERKKILRIGHPSRNFANEFPETCEVRGIEKQISELNKQIQIIREILNIDDYSLDYSTLKEIGLMFEQLDSGQRNHNETESALDKLQISQKNFNNRASTCKLSIGSKNNAIQQYEKKSLGFFNRILVRIYSKFSYQQKIDIIKSHIEQDYQDLNYLESELVSSSKLLANLAEELRKIQLKISDTKHNLYLKKFLNPSLQKLWDNTPKNFGQIKEITTELNKIDNTRTKVTLFKEEYSHLKPAELQQKLNKYTLELENLKSQSVNERWKEAPIIGATIDGFVSRYLAEEITINHVFIDEAAYCSSIKTMIAFALNCPITLLGDHHQLPPVIEMNENELINGYERCFPFLHSGLHIESYFNEGEANIISNIRENSPPYFISMKKSNLIETHRFGQNLASILDKYVYKNGFRSIESNSPLQIEIIHASKILGKFKRDNPSEAEAIKKYLETNQEIDYCILSPYNDQVKLIGSYLPEARQEHKIMTVHKSQGREWDKVIISISDTHNMFFTDSNNQKSNAMNLLNTAVSRAKKSLVIVCDVNYWSKQENQLITGIIESINL